MRQILDMHNIQAKLLNSQYCVIKKYIPKSFDFECAKFYMNDIGRDINYNFN